MRSLLRDIIDKYYVIIGHIVALQGGIIHHQSINDNYQVVIEKPYDYDCLLQIGDTYVEHLGDLERGYMLWSSHLAFLYVNPIKLLSLCFF